VEERPLINKKEREKKNSSLWHNKTYTEVNVCRKRKEELMEEKYFYILSSSEIYFLTTA